MNRESPQGQHPAEGLVIDAQFENKVRKTREQLEDIYQRWVEDRVNPSEEVVAPCISGYIDYRITQLNMLGGQLSHRPSVEDETEYRRSRFAQAAEISTAVNDAHASLCLGRADITPKIKKVWLQLDALRTYLQWIIDIASSIRKPGEKKYRPPASIGDDRDEVTKLRNSALEGKWNSEMESKLAKLLETYKQWDRNNIGLGNLSEEQFLIPE